MQEAGEGTKLKDSKFIPGGKGLLKIFETLDNPIPSPFPAARVLVDYR